MLGKQVKSGAVLTCERVIKEHTDRHGYISIRKVQMVRNQPIMKRLLKDKGYEPVLSALLTVKGYQLIDAGRKTQEEKIEQKIKDIINDSLIENGRVLFSRYKLLKDNKRILVKISVLLSENWHEVGKTIVPIYKPSKDGRQKMIGYQLEPII